MNDQGVQTTRKIKQSCYALRGLIADAFEVAKEEFLLKFPNCSRYDFSKHSTIGDVYEATDQIQREQASKGTLRNLAKIKPFLDGLAKYEKVIETLVQVKPDVLALIWVACSYVKTCDKLLDAMAQIGAVLPNFQIYTSIFEKHNQIYNVLCLFFQDILDFHGTVVSFFSLKGWKEVFEIIWPKYSGKLEVILENIKKHAMLMQGEVTLAHIIEVDEGRKLALQEYERAHESEDRRALDSVISSLNPVLYDKDLERLSSNCAVGTGHWLSGNSSYIKWRDAVDDSSRLFWIQGIPGAGKSYLCSTIVQEMCTRREQLAFAFLTYRHRYELSALGILHSFMYQLALDNKSLRPVLTTAHDEHYRKLNSSISFAKDVLCKLVGHQKATYFVVDGLDEIATSERTLLVKTLLQMQVEVTSLKVLFS
ncbi:hypothetical protein SLS57_012494 [Botryosphaeria dothidea]